MNLLFLTQGASLEMFYGLMHLLREPLVLERVGFYVADSRHFGEFRGRHPEIETGGFHLLKEWEITARARQGAPDLDRIHRYEAVLGDPTLWGPLVGDRRLFTGPLSSLRQDDRPRLDHRGLLRVLEEGLAALERLFDQLRPDAVVSFVCVTFGEYLAYLLARARGIPFLNLRPTRIRNYVTYGESVVEPSARIRARYEEYRARPAEDRHLAEARNFIQFVRTEHAKYEGVLSPSRTPVRLPMRLGNWSAKLAQAVGDEYRLRFGDLRVDYHPMPWATATLYRRLLNPLRARRVHRRLAASYVQPGDLPRRSYVFFPLHTEPEVTLLVYSRPFLSQIDVLRSVCLSVPVGMPVVVKEHPASVGKRPLAFYEKILELPNARIADPGLPSRGFIEGSALVATIAGSMGLEALLRARPVLTFGATPYGYLPSTMTRRASDLLNLARDVGDLLEDFRCDDVALESFVAATIRESAAVNLYSNLLGKIGVYAVGEHEPDQDLRVLADYTISSLALAGARAAAPAAGDDAAAGSG